MDPYQSIAVYYDCEHADFRDDIAFYRNIIQDGPVLEVGTGTGRVMLGLVEAGHEVWGLDPSEAMLERARQRLAGHVTAHLIHASIADLHLDRRFHAAILPLNVLWHLPDLDSQLQALKVVRQHMHPGALLVVDVSNPYTLADRGAAGEVRERFHGLCNGHPLTIRAAAWDNEGDQVLSYALTYDEVDAHGYVHRAQAELELRYTYRYELELLLRLADFTVHHVYGSYDLDLYESQSPDLIIVAQAS